MYGQNIGVFNVEGGHITLSDPCYNLNSYGNSTYPAKNGQWMAFVEYGYEGSYRKPKRLSAVHIDYTMSYEEHPFFYDEALGVDSGQMSIWCTSQYNTSDLYEEIGNGDGIAHHGGGTLSDDKYYLSDYGVASGTFSGDGVYLAQCFIEELDLQGAEELEGTLIAVEIPFA